MLLFEARKTLKLAIPIILGELAQMSLGIIDTAMVGSISYKHLAAAALVMSVMNIPFVFGIGITISVAQMVSMAHGRFDAKQVSHYLYNGFWLCVIAAIAISFGLEMSKNILYHLKQDPEVVAFAVPYFQIMAWSVIPMLLFLALKQFTDGLEFTKTAMLLSLLALPINVFLNWIMIFGNLGFPKMDLVGAGIATLITRTLIFFVLGWIILSHSSFRKYVAVRKKVWQIKWQTQKELLNIGLPSSFQITMEAGAFAISGIIIGTISAVDQAAHQIALSIASLTFMVSMGLSQAGSIRASNNYGRKDWTTISWIGKSTLITALIYGTTCAIGFSLFRHQLPLIFNKNQQVVELSAYLLLFAAVFQISDSVQAICAGLLRGIKDVKVPTYFIAIAYWIIGIPFGYYLAFYQGMGAAGIWVGFIIGLTLSAIFLTIRFRRIVKRNK